MQRGTGEEVSVWFKDHSIKNNQTFFTDSNSLDMVQRRVKGEIDNDNFKPKPFDPNSYETAVTRLPKLQVYERPENNQTLFRVAENLYPLTSAIRIYDNPLCNQSAQNSSSPANATLVPCSDTFNVKQMFVTVDRPQGGQSLQDGEIEIIQNRRISTLDNKGLGESYNELENGEGIHTNNTYFVGLPESRCSNTQRLLQLEIQEPPQIFVNALSGNSKMEKRRESLLETHSAAFNKVLAKAGVKDFVRIVQFPIFEQNSNIRSMLLRLENLNEGQTFFVDLQTITDFLFLAIKQTAATTNQISGHVATNHTEDLENFQVIETTHAGTLPQERVNYTVDADGNINTNASTISAIRLQPMSLRSFKVSYFPSGSSETKRKEIPVCASEADFRTQVCQLKQKRELSLEQMAENLNKNVEKSVMASLGLFDKFWNQRKEFYDSYNEGL